MSTAPRGWSKAGARHYGLPEPEFDGDCYYCGVPGCTECGPPPALLSRSDIIATDDDEDGDS